MSRFFPPKNRAAVGGSLENFILDQNFQSRSKSRFFFDLWALWEHYWTFWLGILGVAKSEKA